MTITERLSQLKKKSRKAQWAFIRKVIENDATGHTVLYDKASGQFCVIGGLAYALGWKPKEDDGRPYDLVSRIPVIGTRVDNLWRTNDDYHDTRARRAALRRLTKRWEAEDIEGPA